MAIGKTNAQRKILLTTPDAITPTKAQQIITTPDGYDGIDQITVNAIPSNYIDTTINEKAATEAQILYNQQAYVNGKLVKGTMTNRGKVGPITLNATTTSYTIPKGYHNGSGKVQHSTATQAAPTISVSNSGVITASSTQSAGYVSSGTKSATYTLSSSDDSNFIESNIKNGVTIFGTRGSYSPSASQTTLTFTGAGIFQASYPTYINEVPGQALAATLTGAQEQSNGCIWYAVIDFNTGYMGVAYYYSNQILGAISYGSVSQSGSQITINSLVASSVNLYFAITACMAQITYLA